jgi:MFS family permease
VTDRGGLRRNRDYLGWVAGEALSDLGTSLSTFAYPLLVLFATHSPARTGIVAAAANIGSLVTMLIGGALADRWSRRALLVGGALIQSAVVASVGFAVLAGRVVLIHVAAAGFVDGAIVGITNGAHRATLRRVVDPADLPAASAAYQARVMGVRVAGPPLGGVLFTAARAIPFLADAGSYFASVFGVLVIRRPLGPDKAENEVREPFLTAVAGGMRFLAGNAYLRFVAWWAATMNLLGSGLMLLLILLVRSHHGSAQLIGFSQAVGSAGGIVGAIASGWAIRRFAGRRMVITLTWVIAIAAFGMAVIPAPIGIGAMLALVSVVAVPLNIILDTYEMQIIPDAMLGRVSTTIDLAANGLRWVAPLLVGTIVEATSARTCAVIWGSALTVLAIVVMTQRSLDVLNQPIEAVATST